MLHSKQIMHCIVTYVGATLTLLLHVFVFLCVQNGKCYTHNNGELKDWHTARKTCQQKSAGAVLGSPRSNEENNVRRKINLCRKNSGKLDTTIAWRAYYFAENFHQLLTPVFCKN